VTRDCLQSSWRTLSQQWNCVYVIDLNWRSIFLIPVINSTLCLSKSDKGSRVSSLGKNEVRRRHWPPKVTTEFLHYSNTYTIRLDNDTETSINTINSLSHASSPLVYWPHVLYRDCHELCPRGKSGFRASGIRWRYVRYARYRGDTLDTFTIRTILAIHCGY